MNRYAIMTFPYHTFIPAMIYCIYFYLLLEVVEPFLIDVYELIVLCLIYCTHFFFICISRWHNFKKCATKFTLYDL